MHKNDEYIESLLLKFIDKKLTDEEVSFLKDWLSQSEGNRTQAKSFCEFYHHIDAFSVLEHTDTNAAFEKTVTQLDAFRPVSPIVRYRSILQRVAAILFIPLLGLQLYQWYNKKENADTWITLRTNPGMVASMRLPDSSTVWLNASTKISYLQSFDRERIVKLDGEAFFDVTKDAKKRFKVQTPFDADIEVLGTRFNVDAYHTASTVRTTLEEGKVKLHYRTAKESKSVLLSPSQTVVYDNTQGTLIPNDLNEKTLTSWKDNQIVLKNTSLSELLAIVSKRFNVQFKIKSAGLQDERFTGVFDSQQLITVLEHLKISSHIQYTILNDARKTDGSITVELSKM